MLELREIESDVLIIGGGAAGCYSAITIAENSDAKVLLVDKANIKRSGCLAAGVNALNAYINEGETPDSYVDYVKKDSAGIIREDLVYSIAQGLNEVTTKIESLGLPIFKDATGKYVSRGKRSIKINGENIKPILAKAVESYSQVEVLNRVNVIDYIIKDNQVIGAYGFSIESNTFYCIHAKAVICATGGAAGLYRPNNPGFSRHKMWYSPFNTGAGYAMGIRAGAEMTTFEMRFIALRCKDTIAPTGTVAQGIKAQQVNAKGEEYVTKYGKPTTPMRLYSTVMENQKGQGPCFLNTNGITPEQEEDLYKAYLNMAPAQTLRWMEKGVGPASENVEIEGTEPYIVGGHTASGYWIDTKRATTIPGLFAAGDVAGGSPKKYVTGCFVEGKIAALSALDYVGQGQLLKLESKAIEAKLTEINNYLQTGDALYTVQQVEEAMQKVMDEYAGGISAGYVFSLDKLAIAKGRILELMDMARTLKAKDLHELMFIFELIDRLEICLSLIHHLEARHETRWKSYQENADYPQQDDENWLKYVNSKKEGNNVKILYRELVGRDQQYEH